MLVSLFLVHSRTSSCDAQNSSCIFLASQTFAHRQVVLQGDKCLADICRPIAGAGLDGNLEVIRPNATANCCLLTVHAQQDGADKCFLLEVCEDDDSEQVSSSNARLRA